MAIINSFSRMDMEKARQAIASMIDRSEKVQVKFAPGTSQHTLQKNRIKALHIASSLIARELASGDIAGSFSTEELNQAVNPISSLISKSEKAQKKLAEGTWQHTMLGDNLKALYIAAPLLSKALREI